jgi:hypothetical protein
LFTNYVISKKKTKTKIETNMSCICEWIDPAVKAHRLYAVEPHWKRQHRDSAQVSFLSAPKDKSSSLLDELAATICSRRAVDFILHIYTNWTNNYIIKFDYLKTIRQYLPYTGDYLNFLNLLILTIYIPQTNWFYFINTGNFIFFNFISFSKW